MIKTQIILLTLIGFTLICCNSKPTQTGTIVAAGTATDDSCHPYFIFDHVEHYFISTTDHEYMLLDTKKNPTENDSLLKEILSKGVFRSLKDSSAIKYLETIGYKRKEVNPKLNEVLSEIFCERQHEKSMASSCIPMFRNIFVFKNHGKTVGIAKICYSCMLSNIVGSQYSTAEFGQSGDFDKLKMLMSQKNDN